MNGLNGGGLLECERAGGAYGPIVSTIDRDERAGSAGAGRRLGAWSLVARFVDRGPGIFLTAWEISIFPGLWADSLSANDILSGPETWVTERT